jgi:hypothetical protein
MVKKKRVRNSPPHNKPTKEEENKHILLNPQKNSTGNREK